MKRLVGEASSVNRSAILRVSVENAGWSEGEVVNPSSMHELNTPASPRAAATEKTILRARGARRLPERDFAIS